MRELQTVRYDNQHYTDENSLYKLMLTEPARLSRKLTYLWGKDSEMFPLLTMTMGQKDGLTTKAAKALGDTQYTWDIMGRMKYTVKVVRLYTSTTTPGIANSTFQVVFETDLPTKQFGLVTPDKQNHLRIQSEPSRIGVNQYLVTLQLQGGSLTEYVALANFTEGKSWVMVASSVPASKSTGNRHTRMAPGRMTNQFGFHRYSMDIAGNIANKKVTAFEIPLEGGGSTNRWMPFEMKQFEMKRRTYNETDLWISKYNRDANGEIALKDPDNGEPIPRGAGIQEAIRFSGNYDTYSTLTLSKLDNTINSVFGNRTDTGVMEIVLYTGMGGAREFHNAIASDASSRLFYESVGDKTVEMSDGSLSYGKYFRRYVTIDGHIITIKRANIFDHGQLAQMDRANGNVSADGFPMESYRMVFLDHSMYDGERNIQVVVEEGREEIAAVYAGMSPLPPEWKAAMGTGVKTISDRKDIATYETFDSMGINIKNYTTSFMLEKA